MQDRNDSAQLTVIEQPYLIEQNEELEEAEISLWALSFHLAMDSE